MIRKVVISFLLLGVVFGLDVEDQPGQNSTVTEDNEVIDIVTQDKNGQKVEETFIIKGTNYVILKSENEEICALVEHNTAMNESNWNRCADTFPLDGGVVSDKLRTRCDDRPIIIYKERECDETDAQPARSRRGLCYRYFYRCYYYICARYRICRWCFRYIYRYRC